MARQGALRRERDPGSPLLRALVLATGIAFVVPLAYVAWRTLDLRANFWAIVTSGATLRPLVKSLALGAGVAISTSCIGVALAWATTRTDAVGVRILRVLAPLPLVFPSFVGAIALRAGLGPGGLISEAFAALGVSTVPTMRGYVGAWVVLTLFTYPYVYLPVMARFRSLPDALEDSARTLGRSRAQAFRAVVWPQISSSAAAGALLVFLYAISDFGAVTLMGYDTLTEQIYADQLYDQPRAMTLSLVLGICALVVVGAERFTRRNDTPLMATLRPPRLRHRLGRWRWPVSLGLWLIVTNALIGPLLVLGLWALRGLTSQSEALGLRVRPDELVGPTIRTIAIGLVTALVAVAVVFPVAWLNRRHRSKFAEVSTAMVVAGFAMPGVVVALAVVFLVLGTPGLRLIYQTLPVLVGTYVIHFGAQATRAAAVAVDSVPANASDAARTLGAAKWQRLRAVELPAMTPSLVAGGGLVLLSTMKELPATLLLAPIGFTTLATRIWSATSVGTWAQAGLGSIVLVAMSGLLTWLFVTRRSDAV